MNRQLLSYGKIAQAYLVCLLFCFSFVGNPQDAMAQERIVTGQVTSTADTQGLPGVNILIKGTSTGMVSDIDGGFSITIPDEENVTLVFSIIGFGSSHGLRLQPVGVGNTNIYD